ncbi:hypothetical protein E2562_022128 [Oryza meyeriana var. granulata]|uniref:Uncharacterized protein n=1 Tax=Oryza meyeriana var. granulata TaxID=110450 RepID=A0A6G1BMW3_9ORYZ|nr:hypothetical protein E2562_022128 [Oryza meyeriana var. granulata]
MAPAPMQIPRDSGDGVWRDGGAARDLGASPEGSTVDPKDSKRAGKCPQDPSPPRSQKPQLPPSPPRVAAMWGGANDAEAGGSGRPRNPEVQPSSVLETRTAGPKVRLSSWPGAKMTGIEEQNRPEGRRYSQAPSKEEEGDTYS